MCENGRKKARLNNCQPGIDVNISSFILCKTIWMGIVHPKLRATFFDRLPIKVVCSGMKSASSRLAAIR